MRISDWSSDVCSSDLAGRFHVAVCAFRSSAKISKISEALLVMLKRVPHPRKNVSDPILERIAALPAASHSVSNPKHEALLLAGGDLEPAVKHTACLTILQDASTISNAPSREIV